MVKSFRSTQHKSNQNQPKSHTNQLISDKFCSSPVLLPVPTNWKISALVFRFNQFPPYSLSCDAIMAWYTRASRFLLVFWDNSLYAYGNNPQSPIKIKLESTIFYNTRMWLAQRSQNTNSGWGEPEVLTWKMFTMEGQLSVYRLTVWQAWQAFFKTIEYFRFRFWS